MRFVVIGAGVAGLACARRLVDAGHAVVVLDKGRGPGGRLASRRLGTPDGEVILDLGAQSFSAAMPDFAAEVTRWAAAGLVAPWPAAGPGAWVGVPTMSALVRHLAGDLEIRWGVRVTGVAPAAAGWSVQDAGGAVTSADAVVTALPSEQTAELLSSAAPAAAAAARARPSQPCWTVLLDFAGPVALAGDVHVGGAGDPIALAVRNRGKPGRTAAEGWVLHAATDWSVQHLAATPEAVIAALSAAFAGRTGAGLPVARTAQAHRWRYARPAVGDGATVWDSAQRLGVCGDWCEGGDVEAAWRSGVILAARITSGVGPAPR